MIGHSCLINWFFNASWFVEVLKEQLHWRWKMNWFSLSFSQPPPHTHTFPLSPPLSPSPTQKLFRRVWNLKWWWFWNMISGCVQPQRRWGRGKVGDGEGGVSWADLKCKKHCFCSGFPLCYQQRRNRLMSCKYSKAEWPLPPARPARYQCVALSGDSAEAN